MRLWKNKSILVKHVHWFGLTETIQVKREKRIKKRKGSLLGKESPWHWRERKKEGEEECRAVTQHDSWIVGFGVYFVSSSLSVWTRKLLLHISSALKDTAARLTISVGLVFLRLLQTDCLCVWVRLTALLNNSDDFKRRKSSELFKSENIGKVLTRVSIIVELWGL